MQSKLSEFELIQAFFEGLGPQSKDVCIGIGDDCAVINIPPDKSLCLSMDTMVEGVHFLPGAPADKVAYRALAAAMSDLAAMGAEPSHFTLSLTLPESNHQWLTEFSQGLTLLAEQFHFPLVGGDTTKGPLTIALQVHGFTNKDQALTRSGAQDGDVVAVTGTLGDAGAALAILSQLDAEKCSEAKSYLLERYYAPTPRIKQGLELRALANACIDISDGLLADAEHMAEKSALEVEIDLDCLPLSDALLSEQGDKASAFALSAGDDYELLFTMSEANWQQLNKQDETNIYTKIGRVKKGHGVVVKQGSMKSSSGKLSADLIADLITTKGYKHFE